MTDLSTAQLRQACRIFMDLAYPEGPATIPIKKRAYYNMDSAQPLTDYLPPAPAAGGIAQDLSTRRGGASGYEFRLGCAGFIHLKLQAQRMEHQGGSVWVFSVDTHDAVQLQPDHPDWPRWRQLQAANRELKMRIERAWDADGLLTFNGLLRRELGRK